jgi:hypothetical protein
MTARCLGTEHLLLGLLDEGVTAHVLDHLDIDPVKVRSLLLMLAGTAEGAEARGGVEYPQSAP